MTLKSSFSLIIITKVVVVAVLIANSIYNFNQIHRLMLEDESRTMAYQNAILGNDVYFKDKTVMDVGCGTGILSIFCAQAGAKKVYAVEASDLANLAKEVVKENGFDEVIEVFISTIYEKLISIQYILNLNVRFFY